VNRRPRCAPPSMTGPAIGKKIRQMSHRCLATGRKVAENLFLPNRDQRTSIVAGSCGLTGQSDGTESLERDPWVRDRTSN
jgi:hypothetical protein